MTRSRWAPLWAILAVLAFATPASASVLTWGENTHGEAGVGYVSPRVAAGLAVQGLPADIVQVAAGEGANVALRKDGTILTWGGNEYGQLGIGRPTRGSTVAIPVPGVKNVKEVSAAGNTAVLLMRDGTVEMFGGNLFGEAGNGTSTHGHEVAGEAVSKPQVVPGLTGVVKISGGGDIAAVLADGTVKAWGPDSWNQLGLGFKTLDVDVPTLVPGLANVKEVDIGAFGSYGGHMLALLNDGTVMTVGRDTLGALGFGSFGEPLHAQAVPGLPPIEQISGSFYSSLARTADGHVYAWGDNGFGELGIGSAGPQGCGLRVCSTSPVLLPLTAVSEVRTGRNYNLALSGGKVFAWGGDELGQLGDAAGANQSAPTLVPNVSHVSQLAASNTHADALSTAAGLPPAFTGSRTGASITVRWTTMLPGPFHISYRPMPTKLVPAIPLKLVTLPSTARSFTVPVGEAQEEVRLNAKGFGPFVFHG